MVIEALDTRHATPCYQDLAVLMGLDTPGQTPDEATRRAILRGTLVRRIEHTHFDSNALPWHPRIGGKDLAPLELRLRCNDVPQPLPSDWEVLEDEGATVRLRVPGSSPLFREDWIPSTVQAAGQLPRGFDPAALYPERQHPRGIQMTVYGASDALLSLGLPWQELYRQVSPDQISVYAGSSMSQLDECGNGGMLRARMMGQRVSAKNCALGFSEMPADFINAYILGSIGCTGNMVGACASFLYNLQLGITDIRTGRSRIALVGSSEAPITPEVIEGYAAMGALATDEKLRRLDGLADDAAPDYSRACRPFGENCGFTIGESAQFFLLMDDELALETGATIHAAPAGVFVNADGHKKSITAPGVGNYVTMAKALACATAILGEKPARHSCVLAHGTSTPQNRLTESHVLSESARAFGIQRWPVSAIKCFLGHSIGAAGGDQLAAAMGIWEYGILPGITTIDQPAGDVHTERLDFLNAHQSVADAPPHACIINAKGFGGNNASATLLAPHVVHQMLERKHGRRALGEWRTRNEAVRERTLHYDEECRAGRPRVLYMFGEEVLGDDDIRYTNHSIELGKRPPIDLHIPSPYPDMDPSLPGQELSSPPAPGRRKNKPSSAP